MNSDSVTIEEAAELLNVSQSHVQGLVSQGIFTLHAGDQLRREDVMRFRHTRNQERESALDEMVALGEEHELPY